MNAIDIDLKEKTNYKEKLFREIQQCGVTLSIWKSLKNKWEWTSLMGTDKKKLFKKLPEKFELCLPEINMAKTRKLWEDFYLIYLRINELNLSEEAIVNIEQKSLEWGKYLCTFSGCGYDWAQPITSYIHFLIKHSPSFLRQFGAIK